MNVLYNRWLHAEVTRYRRRWVPSFPFATLPDRLVGALGFPASLGSSIER
jgi:hypothetical protein